MEIYALTFVKLNEHHLGKFGPDQEDDFYQAVEDIPWWVRRLPNLFQALAAGWRWLLKLERPRHRLGTRKAGAE